MIYFDNAATTFPKPMSVAREMSRCLTEYCGNPGRSGHPLSLAAAEAVFDARMAVASFFGSEKPENVVFTGNATEALNLALFGSVREGSRVLTTNLEHNSVLRPLAALRRERHITLSTVNALYDDEKLLSEVETELRRGAETVVMTHMSNICPRVLPVSRIGALCRRYHATFIVDAAQSAGVLELHMAKDGISVLCVPGHKGLYGPQGSGFCLFADDFDFARFSPLLYGGNGKDSASRDMGHESPEAYEAGTVATPSIVGLAAGIRYVESIGRESILSHERALYRRMKVYLSMQKSTVLYLPEEENGTLLLLGFRGVTPTSVAAALGEKGVCVRSGLHCAPTAHEALGTGGDGLRVSFSAFNTEKEVDRFADILEGILSR